jgi:subtilisin family serine protease
VDRSHESLRSAAITTLGETPSAPPAEAARHGTHVARVIFGAHDGPVQGVAPGCRGLSVPLFTSTGAAVRFRTVCTVLDAGDLDASR